LRVTSHEVSAKEVRAIGIALDIMLQKKLQELAEKTCCEYYEEDALLIRLESYGESSLLQDYGM
jgi:hypothetical protein